MLSNYLDQRFVIMYRAAISLAFEVDIRNSLDYIGIITTGGGLKVRDIENNTEPVLGEVSQPVIDAITGVDIEGYKVIWIVLKANIYSSGGWFWTITEDAD